MPERMRKPVFPASPDLGLLTPEERQARGIQWLLAETGCVIPRSYLPSYVAAAQRSEVATVIELPPGYQIDDNGQQLDESAVRIALPGPWLEPDTGKSLGTFFTVLAEVRGNDEEVRIDL